ncbi:hypothetical protein F5148DRAFT_1286186 [Russula earlei]|uniref:Uncharacterized protein n=1 Tax=Russula earlei TaxID=71964 RepID=A0ACC0U4Y4_9AGAM|nr:hypothetical protein F5148DRAFT_1286186 [Russula earlei]
MNKPAGRAIFWVLKKAEVLDVDKKTGRISTMEDTNELLDIITTFHNKKEQSKVRNYKDTLIYDAGHTYFVFVWLYYVILPTFSRNVNFDQVIAGVSIFIITLYIFTSIAFNILNKTAGFEKHIQCALYEDILKKIFTDYGIDLHFPTDKIKLHGIYVFTCGHTEYLLKCNTSEKLFSTGLMKRYIKATKDINKKAIIFTSIPLRKEVNELSKTNAGHIQVINFKDKEELVNRTNEFIIDQL